MNTRTKLIVSTALLALFSVPASARIDGDEGGASAYPRFKNERHQMSEFRYPPHYLINRPFHRR